MLFKQLIKRSVELGQKQIFGNADQFIHPNCFCLHSKNVKTYSMASPQFNCAINKLCKFCNLQTKFTTINQTELLHGIINLTRCLVFDSITGNFEITC